MVPPGFRQMGSQGILDLMAEHQREEATGRERQRVKVQATAQICHAYGVSVRDMTPAMREMANALERRMTGESTKGKGFGWSIPTEDRNPQR